MLGTEDFIPFYGTNNVCFYPDQFGDWDAVARQLNTSMAQWTMHYGKAAE
jgi:hypothetical protein